MNDINYYIDNCLHYFFIIKLICKNIVVIFPQYEDFMMSFWSGIFRVLPAEIWHLTLTVFSIIILRMFWWTTIICICFSTPIETPPKPQFADLCRYVRARIAIVNNDSSFLVRFLNFSENKQIVVYHSCSSGTVNKLTVFLMLLPPSAFVGFG